MRSRRFTLRAHALRVLGLAPTAAVAQRAAAPVNVTVQGTGTAATIEWSATRLKGVTYRVLRSANGKYFDVDLTPSPVGSGPVVDQNPPAGTTSYYQVVAIYPDGSTSSSTPVGYTAPAAAIAMTGRRNGVSVSQRAAAATAAAPPTAVTGLAVTGSLASATITWTPVPQAVSYTVNRTAPSARGFPPLTTPSLTDGAPYGLVQPGVYSWTVTATLASGSTISGQVSWTRPDPSCAAPAPNQPLLAVLDPTTAAARFAVHGGPYPLGGVFTWSGNAAVAAYRVERSPAGANAWTVVGTSCPGPNPEVDGTIVAWGPGAGRFADRAGGTVPNTAYQYRFTAFAATGEVGIGTVAWTSPAQGTIRWLSAAVSGSTVTLTWRYEPPLTNPPAGPAGFSVTAPYGLNAMVSSNCLSVAGCSKTVLGVPRGTHRFRAIVSYGGGGATGQVGWSVPRMGELAADTTIVVP